MNEEKIQALKNYSETGLSSRIGSDIPTTQEQPKIIYLLEYQQKTIYQLLELKDEIQNRLHRLEYTNFPSASGGAKEPPEEPMQDDIVSMVGDCNRSLSRLLDDLHGINKKLIGLI